MSVSVVHPHAELLVPVARTYTEVLAGRWGIAAEVCASRLRDPADAARTLDRVGRPYALPAEHVPVVRVVAAQAPAAVTFEAAPGVVSGMLDLFLRILCGQWDEMRYHTTLRGLSTPPRIPPDLMVLRVAFSRSYDDTLPWDERGFPAHPAASIGIAQATLPARVAYHAYTEINGGSAPTFGLPDGALRVEHT